MSVENEESILLHFHLSDDPGSVEEETITLADGTTAQVIWKDVLVEGTYPMSPGPTGAVAKPMTIKLDGESDYDSRTISMSDLMDAHEEGAFRYVTIPTRHKDEVLDNTGFVPRPDGLRVIQRDGKNVMQAALGFTEPDVKGKVKRGTIPDVSAGILFNFMNKAKQKVYRAAMKHVALTGVPFMGNLEPFKPIFASDDEIGPINRVEFYQLADEDSTPAGSGGANDSTGGNQAEIVWNEQDSFNWVRNEIEAALRPDEEPAEDGRPLMPRPSYYVEDVSRTNTALVTEYFRGDRTRWVIPFTVEENKVTIGPQTRWVEVREAMVAASDDFEEGSFDTLRERLSVKLAEIVDSNVYGIDNVSLDRRARITGKDGAAWIAEFSVGVGGEVDIAPPHQWEKVEASTTLTDDQTSDDNSVVHLEDDSLEGRLRSARRKRRLLVQQAS
jgi:hypothetical protein